MTPSCQWWLGIFPLFPGSILKPGNPPGVSSLFYTIKFTFYYYHLCNLT